MVEKINKIVKFGLVLIISLILIIFLFSDVIKQKDESIKYGYVPGAIVDAPSILLVNEKNSKVRGISFKTGRDSMEAVITGAVEVSTAAIWPYLLALQRDPSLRIIAVITNANSLGIIARKSSGISTISDLNGKNIGFTQATSSQILLESFAEKHNLKYNGINLNPSDMALLIKNRKIDVAVTWEPNLNIIQNSLGNDSILINGSTLHQKVKFLLVAKESYIKENKNKLESLLTQLMEIEKEINLNPESSQKKLSLITGIKKQNLGEIWNKFDFQITLDEDLIQALEAQDKWGKKRGFIPISENYNFENFIYEDLLKKN